MRMTSLAAMMVIAASTAMAQGTTSPGTTTSPSTAPSTPPSTAPAPGTTTMQKQSANGQLQFYTRQAGEMRASALIGATVRNDQNESIGEINELILNKDGQVAAAVVGVGGFLGIGEREVAVDFKSLRVEYDPNAMTNRGAINVKVVATKDTLKSAPAWSWGDRGSGTTGTTGDKPVAK
jgi:sporulation protein YlmC with PRC-barrel domain